MNSSATREGVPLIFNMSGIEKSMKHVSKIEELLEVINNDFQKRMRLLFEKDFDSTIIFIHQLKHFLNLYNICLLEICHELQFIGLDYFPKPILKLFQSFKMQSACFLRFHISFFQKAQQPKEEKPHFHQDFLEGGEFNEGQVQEFVDYIKLTKGLSKSQMQAFSGDKYAKMEKAKFLLEQEGYELDKILFDMKKGKDEVDSFLKTSLNFKHVTSSGASKILENMLRRLRSEEFLFNYDSLLKAIDKEFEQLLGESVLNTDLIHEITKKIMIKLDLTNKKKIELEKKNILRSQKTMESEQIQLTLDKMTQTDDKRTRQSIAMEKKKKTQDLKKTEDLDKGGLEQKVKDLEFEKKFLIDKLEEREVKILKKKEKIQNLRILIEELKEKLGQFNDRDLQSMHLLKMKETQIEDVKSYFFEKETQYLQKIKDAQTILQEKDAKIKEISNENSNLYLALEFNKTHEAELEKIDENVEKSSNSSKKSLGNPDETISSKHYSNSPKNDRSFSKTSKKAESSSMSPTRKKTLISPKKSSDDSITRRNTQAVTQTMYLPKVTDKKASVLLRAPTVPEKTRKSSFSMANANTENLKSKTDISTLNQIDEIPSPNLMHRPSIAKNLKRNSKSVQDFKNNIITHTYVQDSLNLIDSGDESKNNLPEEKPQGKKNISSASDRKVGGERKSTTFKQMPKPKTKIQPKAEITVTETILPSNFNSEILMPNASLIEENSYIRKNLELIAKFHFLRKNKKLHSMYITMATTNKEKEKETSEIIDTETENKLLFEIIRKKNPILLFSQHIFPKNKPYQKKVEFILDQFLNNSKKSDYFDFIFNFLKTKDLPFPTQQKTTQTISKPLLTTSSQTDSMKDSDSTFRQKETTNLMKIIEKLQKNGQDWDFTNTTSSSIESKTDKNMISTKSLSTNKFEPPVNEIRKFTTPERFLGTKRNNLNVHLNSSNFSRKSAHEQTLESIMNVPTDPMTVRVNKTTESLHSINNNFSERNNNNKHAKMNSTSPAWKEVKTENDDLVEEPKVEDVITKEVFDHLQNMSKKDEKNYAKIKFLFKYPFRSINAKFDEKKMFLEEKEKIETENDKEELNYDKFQMFFKRMVKMHKKCGVNCVHLRRFFQKIGFQLKVASLKQEMFIPKSIINKLPKIA